jgi:hypothetical protein
VLRDGVLERPQQGGTPASSLDVKATATFGPKEGGGMMVANMDLVVGQRAGARPGHIRAGRAEGEKGCPISNALAGNVEITVSATLQSSRSGHTDHPPFERRSPHVRHQGSRQARPRVERELEQYRTELTAYCYRMLASAFEAEDAVQETLIRAWRGYAGFDGRSSVRSWLYRIATNVCLDMLSGRQRRARPMDLNAPARPQVRSATRCPR